MFRSIAYKICIGTLLSLFATTMYAPAAHAKKTCFCVISSNNLTGQQHATGAIKQYLATGTKYTNTNSNRRRCANDCTRVAAPHTGSQSLATQACAKGLPNGAKIRAFSAIGHRGKYQSAHEIGTLKNQPEIVETIYTCPSGWLSNTTNNDGDVTSDGKCKKLSGQLTPPPPPPSNGTPVGDWGFTWGKNIYAWGTVDNGGAPCARTRIKQKAICSF